MILILAGNYMEARGYANMHFQHNNWRHLNSVEQVRGLRGSDVVVVAVGNWRNNSIAAEVASECRIREVEIQYPEEKE